MPKSDFSSLPEVSGLPDGLVQGWMGDEAGLETLRDGWDDLRRRGWTQSPYLSWDWVRGWWGQHRDLFELALWVVRDASGRLQAVAPLVIGREEVGSRRRLRQLGFLAGLGDAQSERMDFLVDEAELERLGPLVCRAVTVLMGRCDALRLNKIPVESPLLPMLRRELEAHWQGVGVLNETLCRFLELPFESWSDFEKSRSTNFRAKNKKLWRQLEQRGLTVVGRASEHSAGMECLERLFLLHECQLSEEESYYLRPRAKAFHRELFAKWLPEGRTDISYLGREGEPLAMVQTLLDGEVGYAFQLGWDESLADASVGRAAMGLAVRDLWAKGARAIDFAGGDYEYKRRWTEKARYLVDLEAYRGGSVRATMFRMARALRRRVKGWARPGVDSAGAVVAAERR